MGVRDPYVKGAHMEQPVHTITPHLVVRNGTKAIDFYKRAFGAQELHVSTTPDGRVMHATLKIGNSHVFLADEFPEFGPERSPETLGGASVTLNVYVPDADAVFNQAVGAGAAVTMPLADQFWGDRYGMVKDPFGHSWAIATHKEDVSPEELKARAEAIFSNPAGH
jgi:PhnB protein